MTPERIRDEFPAPSFRGRQESALAAIQAAFAADNDVVLVRAPTGSGKSLLARAIMGAARTPDEAAPHEPTGAYYTTPQVSQLDAVAADELLADLAVIRGKSNYTCLLDGEEDTRVDRAPCARDRAFDCEIKHKCPYFSDRSIAANRRYAAMTLAYFMQTASTETFGRRDVVVIDEAHGLAEWAEMYATIELSAQTVPIWEDVPVPSSGELDGIDEAIPVAERVLAACERRLETLRARRTLTPAEAGERDQLAERVRELEWFVDDVGTDGSATHWLLDGSDGLTFRPVNPARYLQHTVWDRGEQFALLSATILDKAGFCRGIGLDPQRVALVEVDHTFPLDHRPLYNVAQGKMTYDARAATIPAIARLIGRVMTRHPEEKGIVHAHSYQIQSALAQHLREMGVGARILTHDRDNRDAALTTWLAAETPSVFLAVTMEEALDLGGDLARWQVLCKAPFPNTNDARVAHRLADDQWEWYYRTTLSTIMQACGRVVRARDDYGATYLADSSILDVFDRTSQLMPAWFREQVEAMTTPDLPAVDPPTALTATTPDSPTAPARQPASESGDDAQPGSTSLPPDHPLHDVWG